MLLKPLIAALRWAFGPLYLQGDQSVANQAGASFRADMNNELQAIVSNSSGASAPATTYAYQWWADTTNGLLKQRNAANTGWIVRNTLAETFVIARSANTILGVGDYGRTFKCTGTFTQTFTAAATLGDGWWVEFLNEGTGVITFDPNASETIGGQTTLAFGPGESGIIECDGVNFKIVCRDRYAGAIASGRNIAAKNNATTPNTKLDISADELQLKDANGNVKVATSVAVTIDFGVTGANGIDTGAQAASTWYYGWIIAKEDGTVAGLGSTSSSAPTLPSGYTYKALATASRSNASTQFIKYRQFGNYCYYEAPIIALSSGTATTETSITLTSLIPPIAMEFQYNFVQGPTSDASNATDVQFRTRIVSGTDFEVFRMRVIGGAGTTSSQVSSGASRAPNTGNFYYLHTNTNGTGNTTLSITGFKLPMGGE